MLFPGCPERQRDDRLQTPNLLLIVVDGLRADAIGLGADSTTPAIERLAQEGARFATSTLPSTDPLSNRVSLHTSLPAEKHRVRAEAPVLESSALTVAEVFEERGLATAAFGDVEFLHTPLGLDQGFETFEYIDPAGRALTSRVEQWLDLWAQEERPRSFFLYVHTSVGENEGARERADQQIEQLLAAVEDVETPNETVVVLTSTQTGPLDGSRLPLEADLAAPLIFHHPKRLAPGVVHDDVARGMDLGPTLMMLARVRRPDDFGFTHPAYSLAMRDLVEVLVGVPLDVEMTVAGVGRVGEDEVHWLRLGDWRLVRRTRPDGAIQHNFYDTSEDPGQLDDRFEEEPQRARMHAQRLDAWLAICESDAEDGDEGEN